MTVQEDFFSLLLRNVGVAAPYDWQRVAYERCCAGDVPAQIKVPTAAGKTMLLAAFVAALATQARSGGAAVSLPRRLVHVVNRRVLVDEASNLAERISLALTTVPELAPIRQALSSLSATGKPLVVSRLRGGLADSGEWSLDPSTPAIILATPDMLGSRLLFRGYGVGRSRGATHAGLLGCDTLVVHDEAHLAPAFTRLLRQVETLAADDARRIGRPPLRVIEMTATLSAGNSSRPLVCDVAADAALATRMSAYKRLELVDVGATAEPAAKPLRAIEEMIGTLALEQRDANRAVAIFVSSPGSAERIASRLIKKGIPPERVVTLTGTMRGYERAALARSEAFRRFLPGPERSADGSAYFIATAAGEIGLDIDADLGLFDLSTLDRLIQRAGRINRRGIGEASIRVVHAGGAELPAAIRERAQAALAILHSLATQAATQLADHEHGSSRSAADHKAFGVTELLKATDAEIRSIDASPLALSRLCDLPDYPEAIEAAPATRALEPAIIELLAMTSLRLDEVGCPVPEVFIHGIVEDRAEIRLAWRQLPRSGSDFASWLDAWPIAADEMARLPLEEARRLLLTRLMAYRESGDDILAIALDAQGLPQAKTPFLTGDMNISRWLYRLRPDSTVLLPTSAGGLTAAHGIPSSDADTLVADVSAEFTDPGGIERAAVQSFAVSCLRDDEACEWHCGDQLAPSLDDLLEKLADGHDIVFHDAPRSIDGLQWSGTIRVWLGRRGLHSADSGEQASLIGRDRLLDEHLELAGRAARRLAERLALPREIANASIRSAATHDRGKAVPRWQRAIGNPDPDRLLGKSARSAFDQRINDGYRHELGTLAEGGEPISSLSPLERHLVAAHHGWSRPGFRDAALDKPGCRPAAKASAESFALLGRTLGPWALCYLEALVKTADILAEVLDDPEADPDKDLHSAVPALASEPPLVLPPAWVSADAFPAPARSAEVSFRLPVDVHNFGEYLAALGLASLLDHCGDETRLGWEGGHFVIGGVDGERVGQALQLLQGARVQLDEHATAGRAQDDSYPPLQLVLADGSVIALNHWLDERLLDYSGWKLGAGRTSAITTLESVVRSCAKLRAMADFEPASLFAVGGDRVAADASKFRFDAATSWSARDAGFSLNEDDAFKSTRPWVELLAALGLQRFFVPPADAVPGYYTWRGLLPPTLALVAAKGLLPESAQGFRPVIEASGKMKDVFTSQPLFSERKPTCPANLRIV